MIYNELRDYEDEFFIGLVQAANGKRDWYQFMSDSNIVVFLSPYTRTRPTTLSAKIAVGVIVEEYTDNQNILQCEGSIKRHLLHSIISLSE